MKKYVLVLTVAIAFISCKNDKKETVDTQTTTTTKALNRTAYPLTLLEALKAHGGLQWDAMNNVCFAFEGKAGEEIHTISLKSRKAKIQNENWTIGNDGENTWLLENNEGSYKGNAAFYNNLMFYFYAMPFVLGDNGIVYTELPQRTLDGKKYNALKIAYNDGVGYSSKDEYILFTDPETKKMAWLGYTVTGTSNKKSDKWSFIKYDTWQTVNGLLLPEKLVWYAVENNEPKEVRNELVFKKVSITETVLEDSVFEMPAGAKVME